MATNRAFKGLANLRAGFDQPFDDAEQPGSSAGAVQTVAGTNPSDLGLPSPTKAKTAGVYDQATSPITGKVDRRRLRKVLKTPSVSLSVAVRAELHEDVSALLFAQKSTWIAILDELLTKHVADAKAAGRFPKYS